MPVNSKGESWTGAVKKSSGKELNEKHFQSRSGHCLQKCRVVIWVLYSQNKANLKFLLGHCKSRWFHWPLPAVMLIGTCHLNLRIDPLQWFSIHILIVLVLMPLSGGSGLLTLRRAQPNNFQISLWQRVLNCQWHISFVSSGQASIIASTKANLHCRLTVDLKCLNSI